MLYYNVPSEAHYSAVFALTLPCTGRETAVVELLLVLSVARSPLPAPVPAPAADRSGRRELTAGSKPSTSASTQSRTQSADAEADDEPLVVRVTRRKQCIATLLTPGLVPSRDKPSPDLSHPLTALPPVSSAGAGASAPGLGLDIVGSGDIQVRAGRHPDYDPLATRQQQLEPAEGSNADGAGPTSSSFSSSSSAFAYYIIVAASSSLLLLLACLLLCLFMQSRRRTLKSSALLPVATTACNRRAIDQRAAGAATGPPASGPLTPNTSPNVLSPTERSGSMRVRFNPTAVSSLAAATARYANALYYYFSSCNEAPLQLIKI